MLKAKPLKAIAVVLSATTLGGALFYYNFIDKPTKISVNVGDECPNFTVFTYTNENGEYVAKGEEFILSENKGKVVIINFWATYCGPCKLELPDFDRLQKEYPDDLVVITLNGEKDYNYKTLAPWISKYTTEIIPEDDPTQKIEYKWTDFDLLFGRYETADDIYRKLGFSSTALPATMVLDRNGLVQFEKEGSIHYDSLKEVVLPWINQTANT